MSELPPTRTLRLVLAYDGREFRGWQRQIGVRTVQAEVERAFATTFHERVSVVGASRTDAGVHARGQVAHVRTQGNVPLPNIRLALAHHLPADVALVRADWASPGFHAIRDARGKLYRYRVFNSTQRPTAQLVQSRCWHVWHMLDLDRMRAAAEHWIGRHDFAGLASQGSPRPDTTRTIHALRIRRRFDEVWFDVAGDGFLYNQVRNIVGTLVEIGRGLWPPQRALEILDARDRRLAGPTAPAHGLCLCWVRYDHWWSRDRSAVDAPEPSS